MILKTAENNEISRLKELYEEAFPANERKPFHVLEENQKKGVTDILALVDERFLGLVITVNYKDMVLIDYFAVDSSARGGGIGSKALELIRQKYDGKRVFLEIETPDESSSNNEQRIMRKSFYLRNGVTAPGIYVNVYNTDMELMTFSKPVSFEEYAELYKWAMGEEWLKKFGKPKQIVK